MKAHLPSILGGVVIGLLMAFLVDRGNPGHMGICGACFLRDAAGALGLHRAAPVRYFRPEVAGVVLGALAAALASREFRSRGGAAPFFRLIMGAFVTIGALVFLGCPFRMLQRLGGGDLNAVFGLAGLVGGIGVALVLVRAGTSSGRSSPQPRAAGLLLPLLLAAAVAALAIGSPLLEASRSGPGSQHAPWLLSLGAAAIAGVLLQRLRFCTLGAFRGLVFHRDLRLFAMAAGIIVAYGIASLAWGRFHIGTTDQPIAHTETLWNILAMVLVGLAASLAGGCPVRQMVMAGEGDGDAALTLLGMILGGAFAHNFGLAAGPAGVPPAGKIAVVAGLVFCLGAGLAMRSRSAGVHGHA